MTARPKNIIEGFFVQFLGELSLMVGKKYSKEEAEILLALWVDTFKEIPLAKLIEAKRILINDWNNGYHMPFPSHFKEILGRMKAAVKNENEEETEEERQEREKDEAYKETEEYKELCRVKREEFFAKNKAH
jgi:hypothetical protein